MLTACAPIESVSTDSKESQSLVVIVPKTAETEYAADVTAAVQVALNTQIVQTPEISAEPTQTVAASTPVPAKTPAPTEAYTVKSFDSVKGYVNAKTVNLRKGPGTDYKIIGEYERGDTLKINGESGEWYRVKIDSTTGFMLKEFVEKGTMPTATPKPTEKPKPTAAPTKAPSTPKITSTPSSKKYSDSEIYLIAQVVHLEGKGGTTDGFKAIAGVILNRVNSSSFPDTVEGVIFQKNQFTVARDEDNLRAQKPSSKIIDAVEAVFNGGDNPLPSDVMFFRTAGAGKTWGSREYYKTIDNNAFFR
ncbi:MAG: cell wall hydrolase [Clostridia bacterium]|nr:cell wall hydrolase [Clostridia bacterium]